MRTGISPAPWAPNSDPQGGVGQNSMSMTSTFGSIVVVFTYEDIEFNIFSMWINYFLILMIDNTIIDLISFEMFLNKYSFTLIFDEYCIFQAEARQKRRAR